MKTKPMKHQVTAQKLLQENPEYYALAAEQGTGKTWMILDEIERRYTAGELEAILIIAPKGVHTNWVLREIPKHLSCDCVAVAWTSGNTQKKWRRLDRLLTEGRGRLVAFTMNVDAVNTAKGLEYALKFVNAYKTMVAIDESQRIKNPAAKRTKQVIAIGEKAKARRILSGTIIANSPLDIFSQYEFLRPGLLGTTNYYAFKAEYAEILPANHPMVRQITAKSRWTPQVVKKDENGNSVFRNLDKLQNLLKPVTFRVLKSECLDLPEKIYKTMSFELSRTQMERYKALKRDRSWYRENGTFDKFISLTVITKLQQLTSGFIIEEGEPRHLVEGESRMDMLKEILTDTTGQVIIWARFRAEIDAIRKALKGTHSSVEYHGGTSAAEREAAVNNFQNGTAQIFVANPAAAGTGLTLTAANTAIYFSNSFSLEQRLQSEDRCHRIGTHAPVVYIDLVAQDTIDERIAAALQSKKITAELILGGL